MIQTRYPIFILSKGRWESRFTSRTFEEIGMDYRIVIEEQEYDNYAAVIDPKKILVLPFKNLGQGGIPARNWIWEKSIQEGHERHWVIDDNIRYFYRLHENTRLRVKSSVPLRVCEDYVDRFSNVAMAGLNYLYFAPAFMKKAPAYYNTRIYSCILLDNSVQERWRVLDCDGKPAPFNEDTDLSLQLMKKGYCTILLNSFVVGKTGTLHMKGGNTEAVYKLGNAQEFDNRYTFAASLKQAHPDCVEIVQRYGRWHHEVDYSYFQKNNKMLLKPGVSWPDEYPTKLKLVELDVPRNIKSKYKDSKIEDVRMTMETYE